ncbi:MAG: ABC transporter permease [Verrucomicrobia bacterium]|nr:ABC transporter permease [Verrucomicrobiota bacterium]
MEQKRLRDILGRLKPFAPLFALVILSLLIGLRNPRFFEVNNFIRVANSAAIPLVLALGATLVILLGSVDLSVEGIVALGAVIVAVLVRNDFNHNSFGWLGPLAAIVVGGLIGLLNGFIHVRLRIPSFMVTLGSWFVGVGLATLILGGTSVRVRDPAIRAFALTRFWNLPLAVWVALGALAVAWFLERFTTLGRHVFAVGGGEDLALLSGIAVHRVRLAVFTLAGAFYGVGGVLAAAQLGQGNATIGDGRLFSTITSVVVGGTALTGGTGGMLNTLVGVLIITVIGNGMILLGVSPNLQQAVQGLIIIIAVACSMDRQRMRFAK